MTKPFNRETHTTILGSGGDYQIAVDAEHDLELKRVAANTKGNGFGAAVFRELVTQYLDKKLTGKIKTLVSTSNGSPHLFYLYMGMIPSPKAQYPFLQQEYGKRAPKFMEALNAVNKCTTVNDIDTLDKKHQELLSELLRDQLHITLPFTAQVILEHRDALLSLLNKKSSPYITAEFIPKLFLFLNTSLSQEGEFPNTTPMGSMEMELSEEGLARWKAAIENDTEFEPFYDVSQLHQYMNEDQIGKFLELLKQVKMNTQKAKAKGKDDKKTHPINQKIENAISDTVTPTIDAEVSARIEALDNKIKQLLQIKAEGHASNLFRNVDQALLTSAMPIILAWGSAENKSQCLANTEKQYANLIVELAKKEIKDDKGLTPLHCAISYSCPLIANDLLEKGADVNAITSSGLTPLMFGAITGSLDMIKACLQYHANPTLRSLSGKTALHYIKQYSHYATKGPRFIQPEILEIINLLDTAVLDHKIQQLIAIETDLSKMIDPDFWNAIWPKIRAWLTLSDAQKVLQKDRTKEACDCLITMLAEMTHKDNQPLSALHIAAFHSLDLIVEALLEKNANINAPTPDGDTPLIWGVRHHSIPIVSDCLAHGAMYELKNGNNKTALDYAKELGNPHIIAMLEVAHFDKSIEQLIDLSNVLEKDHKDLLAKFTVEWGILYGWGRLSAQKKRANIKETKEAYDKIISTIASMSTDTAIPLSIAASYLLDIIVVDLLEKNASVNACNSQHEPALIWGVRDGSIPIVTACLQYGANPNLRRQDIGKSALDYVYHSQKDSAVQHAIKAMLVKAGAKTEAELDAKPRALLPAAPSTRTLTKEDEGIPLTSRKSDSTNSSVPSHISSSESIIEDTDKPQHWLLRAFDYNNRMLFEGLFDFVFNRKAAWEAYQYDEDGVKRSYPKTRYVFGIFLRIALLPLTSLVYNISRISLIAFKRQAHKDNPMKALFMFMITSMTAMLITAVAVLTPVFTQYSLQLLSGVATGLAASIGSAIIVGALMSIGLAILLYGAKKMAQDANAFPKEVVDDDQGSTSVPVYVTAPKYLHPFNEKLPIEVKNTYNNILHHYYTQKKPAIAGVDVEQKQLKSILNQFQKVRENKVAPEDWNNLCKATKSIRQITYLNKGRFSKQPITANLDNFEVNKEGKLVPKNIRMQ